MSDTETTIAISPKLENQVHDALRDLQTLEVITFIQELLMREFARRTKHTEEEIKCFNNANYNLEKYVKAIGNKVEYRDYSGVLGQFQQKQQSFKKARYNY